MENKIRENKLHYIKLGAETKNLPQKSKLQQGGWKLEPELAFGFSDYNKPSQKPISKHTSSVGV